jgi:hypothetical protein
VYRKIANITKKKYHTITTFPKCNIITSLAWHRNILLIKRCGFKLGVWAHTSLLREMMFNTGALIHLDIVINKKVEKGSKVIPFKMVEEINQDNPVKVLNKEESVLFLQVQHAQGNIIYFPLPGLRDYVVISPSYVIDVFTSIVTDKNTFTGLSWFISSTILKGITLEPFSTFLLITISKWIHDFFTP